MGTAPKPARRAGTSAEALEPPIDVVESALLGSMLREPGLLGQLDGVVAAEHFSEPIGERVFMALEGIVQSGGAATPTRVADHLGIYQWDRPEGADQFVESLLTTSLEGMSVDDMARAVRAAAERRFAASDAYCGDVAGWAFREIDRLRQLSSRLDLRDAADWPNLIDEIRSVGRSEVDGVARRIELVMLHAIKIVSNSDPGLVRGWRAEIDLHLAVLRRSYAPSMRRLVSLERLWASAVLEARRDLERYGEQLPRPLPTRCPITLEQLLADTDADAIMRLVTERLGRA